MQSQQTAAGLCAQHAVLPYHFLANSDQLNDLGRQDLQAIARQFRQAPGPLTVRRGPEPARLYERRKTAVLAFLSEQGVKTASVSIDNDALDGDGMSSEQVRAALDKMNTSAAAPDSGSTPSGSSSSAPPNNQSGGSQK